MIKREHRKLFALVFFTSITLVYSIGVIITVSKTIELTNQSGDVVGGVVLSLLLAALFLIFIVWCGIEFKEFITKEEQTREKVCHE